MANMTVTLSASQQAGVVGRSAATRSVVHRAAGAWWTSRVNCQPRKRTALAPRRSFVAKVRATAQSSGDGGDEPKIDFNTLGMPMTLHQSQSEFHNNVQVLQFPNFNFPPEVCGARVLMLDHSGNIHSVYREDQAFTSAYWDELAVIDAVAPEGPLAILGLGSGTIAHIINSFAPQRVVHGWELDEEVINVSRKYMGLGSLEEQGALVAHIGDAFKDDITVEGGFAGIIVDIFVEAAIHPELMKAETWRHIAKNLKPGGRVMTNLGAPEIPGAPRTQGMIDTQAALAAMKEAFDGKVSVKAKVSENAGAMLAVTGEPPKASECANLPEVLRDAYEGWKGGNSAFQDVA
mmetsp:Transcript_26647/g.47421  ORF Transcript_26647/g.47421 Transcript_26647/m.47421 type:complete len:348 (-) Transcript_26647:1036-2079(-)